MPSDDLASLREEPALKSKLQAATERYLRDHGFIRALECSYDEKKEIGRKYLKMPKRRTEWEAWLKRRFDLVPLQRLADWIARPRGDIMPDEERREQAYDDLRQAIADGEFGPREKPGVIFFAGTSISELLPATTILAPGGLRLRMTPRVAAIIALSGIEPMSEAWVPRESMIRWYVARQHLLPPAPPWLASGGNQRPAGSAAAPAGAQQMPDEEDCRAVTWRRREWRRQWIRRFAERQRIAKRWIALVDLADWCAQSTTTASLDAQTKAREVAYQGLTDSVRRGAFERGGRSKILYLDNSVMCRCRLTREQFEIVVDIAAAPPVPTLPLTVLNCCWLPRALARHWLESHGYRWAPHFEPGPISAGGRARSRTSGGKARPPSREKTFWPAARDAAFEWLIDNGCPTPGDGNQAALEKFVAAWLESQRHEASESAVRRRVVRWIKERRAELNA